MDYEEFKKMFTELLSDAAGRLDMEIAKTEPLIINKDSDYLAVNTKDGGHEVIVSVEEGYREFSIGRDIGEMAESIVKGIIPYIKVMSRIPPFTGSNAQDSLYLSAVNRDMNQHLMKGIPYEIVGDLAIIPRMHVSEDHNGQANITLTEELFRKLKLTKEEVMEIAGRNTEEQGIRISPLSSVILESYKKNMEANRETVLKKDYLSDSIYQYEHRTKSITMIEDMEKEPANEKASLLSNEKIDQHMKIH